MRTELWLCDSVISCVYCHLSDGNWHTGDVGKVLVLYGDLKRIIIGSERTVRKVVGDPRRLISRSKEQRGRNARVDIWLLRGYNRWRGLGSPKRGWGFASNIYIWYKIYFIYIIGVGHDTEGKSFEPQARPDDPIRVTGLLGNDSLSMCMSVDYLLIYKYNRPSYFNLPLSTIIIFKLIKRKLSESNLK
jgi:hypothetical protein